MYRAKDSGRRLLAQKYEGEDMQDTRLIAGQIQSRGELTLRDMLSPLFRRKRLMILSFSFLALASAGAAWWVSNTYVAHMEVLVNRDRIDPVISTDTTPQIQIPASAITEEEVNSEAALLSSSDVLEKVALENGLDQVEKRSILANLFGKRSESEYISLAAKHLGKKLAIDTPVKTNIVDVTYKNADPKTAYGVLNSLATLYLEKHVSTHRPTGSYDFFAKEADKYRDALADAESRLSSFGKEQGVVAPADERTNMALVVANSTGTLVQTEQAVAADEERIRSDRQEIAKLPERTITKKETNDSDKLLQDLGNALLAAQVKRTQLLSKYDPSYPLVKEADQEIADTKAAIAAAQTTQYVDQTTDVDPTFELLREDIAKTQADLATQRASVASLKQGIQSMQSQMVDLDQKALIQADLLRDAKADEDNYLLYASKREQERASDALDRNRIANVSIAVPPVVPTLPLASFPTVFIIGLMVSLVGSASAAYAVDYLDSSFRTPREVIDILNIPIVATVPMHAFLPSQSNSLLGLRSNYTNPDSLANR
jgi:polysaccharide biosynthesis protein PslE